MNKDVIYIDTEDDITAIIGKVKTAGNKVVALVPPKRIGVLQSAVNLKLLQKAAQSVDRHVVLITNDHSLTALAGGVKIAVAKNLQSRPEVPQLDMPQMPEEEIINGQELPVGDVAKSLSGESRSAADVLDENVELHDASSKTPQTPRASSPVNLKKTEPVSKVRGNKPKLNVPNFDVFRKRLFILIGGGILLILFLVWAIVFAPHAKVTISAKTANVDIQRTLSLNAAVPQSDLNSFNLKPNVQQLKKSVAAQFNATGTKDIGDKAKGSISVANLLTSDPVTLPAGTNFTGADGHVFTSDSSVTVPGATVSGGHPVAGKADAAVTATALGPEYNAAPQAYTVQGHSDLGSASGGQMSGGTKQTVTVVSQEDVDKAKQQLATQDVNAAKAELKKQFGADSQIIEESFTADQGPPTASPAVGQQAQTAKLTVETVYTYVGLSRADVKTMLTNAVNDALKDKTDQQVYSLGDNSVRFENFEKEGSKYRVGMVTTGQIGPKIDTAQLAKQLVGKRSGEIQAIINQISGVTNVDINLSPFWVTTAPAADKIDIKFSVAAGNGR